MNRTTSTLLWIAVLLLALSSLAACDVLQAPTSVPNTPTTIPTVLSVPPTNTPRPTVPPPTATPRVAGLRIAVQAPDNSIKIFGLEGGSTTLTQLTVKLNPINFNTATNAISDTIYAMSPIGNPAPVVTIDSAGVHPLNAAKGSLTAEAVGGGQIVWGSSVISGTATVTELVIAQPEGVNAKSIVKTTIAKGQPPRALTPFQFSKDGTRLYYGLEPSGLGGYILFGGATNLWSYSFSTNKATELIKDKQVGGNICIDGVSPNDKFVAYHCTNKSIGIYDLTAKKTTTIALPTDLKEAKVLGDTRFNPDSTRVAFAAARNNPDNEQGWIIVSTGLTGASKTIAISQAKDYYSLITWLNADTLLLQSHGQQPGVWTVKIDGTGLQKLSDGQFLSLLPARP